MNGNAIKVALWGDTVGYLTWDSSDWRTATAVFRFSEDFLDRGLDISPLRMSLNSILVQSHQNIRGTSPKSRFGGLPINDSKSTLVTFAILILWLSAHFRKMLFPQ